MNKDEWDSLSEESKWNLHSRTKFKIDRIFWECLSEDSKWDVFNGDIEIKFTSTPKIKYSLYGKDPYEIARNFKDEWDKTLEIVIKKHKQDTREDNSDECLFDRGFNYWNYINPFNKKQVMFVDEDGFGVTTDENNWETNKEAGIKSVWQKVESVEELKKGDFVRFWNNDYMLFKDMANTKGIIKYIDDDCVYVQIFEAGHNGKLFVEKQRFLFEEYDHVEKAVLVEE